jgi:hypothetical protein
VERLAKKIAGSPQETVVSTQPLPGLDPKLKGWLEHEMERADDFQQSIRIEKQRVLQAHTAMFSGALGFSGRMSANALVKNIGNWNRKVYDRLVAVVTEDELDALSPDPKYISDERTGADFDRLSAHVRNQADAIDKLLHR